MNGVVCALALFFIQEPQSWTECVLGHQTAKQICVCQIANPTLSKCFKRNLCEVNRFLVSNLTRVSIYPSNSNYPPDSPAIKLT
jgi:hypothetical protein